MLCEVVFTWKCGYCGEILQSAQRVSVGAKVSAPYPPYTLPWGWTILGGGIVCPNHKIVVDPVLATTTAEQELARSLRDKVEDLLRVATTESDIRLRDGLEAYLAVYDDLARRFNNSL